MNTRILSILLVFVLIFSMIPQLGMPVYAAQSNSIEYEMRKEIVEFRLSDGTLYYSNTISYPYFSGDTVAESIINQRYASFIEECRNNTTDFDAQYQETLEWDPDIDSMLPFYDDIYAEVTYCRNGVISIKERSTMWSGGMHPYHYETGLNYELASGKVLTYSNILSGDNNQIDQLLRTAFEEELWKPSDYEIETLKDYTAYTLTDDGLCFYYNVGDAVPRAEIVIPFTSADSYVISVGEKPEKNTADATDTDVPDNGYISAVQKAITDKVVVAYGNGYGTLYDVDGNGTEELFLIHTADLSPDSDYWSIGVVCSVYTMSDGILIPLIEKEPLYYEAGSPWGYVGVVRKDGQTYIAITASNSSVWGTEIEHSGFWTLHTFDGNTLQKATDLEYFCITDLTQNDAVLYDQSSVTINGKEYGYDVYEEWVNGIEELYAVYPADVSWTPQYENTMTLEDLLEHLKKHPVERIPDTIELKAYTAFPESTIGTNQEVKMLFSLYVNSKLTPIEEYALGISNPSVIESTKTIDSDGSRIISFKGLKPGTSDLTLTEQSTGTSVTVTVTVEDQCSYYRCSVFPAPYKSIGSIYVADYSCTVDENGNHDIVFNAYNTSYAYGVVEVYGEDGSLIKLVPLDPRSDGSGMEKVVNGFKWTWEEIKDLFDGETPFYTKDGHAKHTPVTLDNIPENAEIAISSDGAVSDFVTLYTGVDVFVRTVFAASSIDLKTNGQAATVKELMDALVDSLIKSISHDEAEKAITQGLIKEASKNISTSIAFASSTDSISDIYNTVYNLFHSLDIDADSIMLNVLKGMGYGVADAAFTTFVPAYKIVNFVDLILETAWPLVDHQFNLDRGKLEIHVSKHGMHNYIVNSSITITQKGNFSANTVLDTYEVVEANELSILSDAIPTRMTNYTVYNITLRKDGIEVQPDGDIEVQLPAPDGTGTKKCVVYRIEENGRSTLLDSSCNGDYVTFTTSHLSYYIVGQVDGSLIPSLVLFVLSVVCIFFAIGLGKRPKNIIMVIMFAVMAIAFAGIGLSLVLPAANHHHQEKEHITSADTKPTDTMAVLPTEIQIPDFPEPESEPPAKTPTEVPTEPATGIVAISSGGWASYAVSADGTVHSNGRNHHGQCDVSDWENIVDISGGDCYVVGLKADGTVISAGRNHHGQCDLTDWRDIQAVSADTYHTVGLKKDGTVLAAGRNKEGQCNVADWENIVQVDAGELHTVAVRADGTVVATGSNSDGQCNVSGWTDIVAVSAGQYHTIGLKKDGTVVSTGANKYNQCNVSGWKDITAICTGDQFSVGLRSDGTVVAVGWNEYKQCNVGTWTEIVKISADYGHTMGLTKDGTVVAVGWNDYGQLHVSGWT